MPCEHAGPAELIEMAEQHLVDVVKERWSGRRFRWSENVEGGRWASVILEVERRGEQWVVVRLDRNPESVSESELGFLPLDTPPGSG
jgi:hypothetical protein